MRLPSLSLNASRTCSPVATVTARHELSPFAMQLIAGIFSTVKRYYQPSGFHPYRTIIEK